jgi:enterobacterial common antigen flippase
MSDKEKSYRNTALLGVSSVVNILLSVIRNKVFSIYLGPAGIGQFGILNDFINSIYTVGILGVGNSGVQAVSKASTESGDAVKKVFNSLLFAFSIVSVLLVTAIFIFAGPISQSLAGNDTYIIYLRIAAFALLFKFRTSIQSILITGMKRVGMLARANILQGVISTVLGIILVIALRNQAVPYLILSLALGGWIVSYYQSNRVLKELPGHRQLLQFREMSPIFILGFSSLWASLLESVVNLVNKSWINQFFGQDHLGYYQVAIGFTGAYIGFITTSIITNYYPNLVTKVQEGTKAINEYVNQQISISMALIMPLLFIMLTFSRLFLTILFSEKFLAANPLISYTVAGTLIQVVAWPIAYVFLAHRATKTYFISESVGNGSMLLLSFFAVRSGLFPMIGLAYVLHYVIYLALIIFLFYRKFGGMISAENIWLFLINAVIIAGIVISKGFFSDNITYVIGCIFIALYFYRSRKEYLFMLNTILKRK